MSCCSDCKGKQQMNAYQQMLLARSAHVAGLQLVGAVQPSFGQQLYAPNAPGVQNAVAQSGQPLAGLNPGSAGSYIQQTQPTQVRRFPFPMPSTTLAAGASGTSVANAQVPTKPVRLIMAETTGPSSLTDITIGIKPQFAALVGNYPIAAFGATATDTMTGFDTAQTGQAIVLSLTNAGGASSVITAGFLADIAQ